MYLLLSQRHILRIIWFLALFGLNPLELSKEAPTVGTFTPLAFSSLALIYLRKLFLTSSPTETPLASGERLSVAHTSFPPSKSSGQPFHWSPMFRFSLKP